MSTATLERPTGGPSAEGLPGGWTLTDLTQIARYAARSQRGRIIDLEEARDVAAVAVIEALYSGSSPTRLDLFRAARDAVGTANDKEMSFCGLDKNIARSGRMGPPPRWAIYWYGQSALVSPFEEPFVERYAVRQVFAALPERDQETLNALARQGTFEGARAALGVSARSWGKRLEAARAEARALWHWPETPAPQWGLDRPTGKPDAQGRNRGLMYIARRKAERRNAATYTNEEDPS